MRARSSGVTGQSVNSVTAFTDEERSATVVPDDEDEK
jgi:hypothetical protein